MTENATLEAPATEATMPENNGAIAETVLTEPAITTEPAVVAEPAKPKRPRKTKPAAAKPKAAPKPKKTDKPHARKQLNAEELATEEKTLLRKYKRIVPGSLKNASTNEEHEFFQKRTVIVACATPGCEKTRRIATSDLHQVKFCEGCTRDRRLARRRKARKAASKG